MVIGIHESARRCWRMPSARRTSSWHDALHIE
jgi:hypothetical protein